MSISLRLISNCFYQPIIKMFDKQFLLDTLQVKF